MKHPEEQILELLVLGDQGAKRQEKRIRKHLTECVGCRRVYDEMKDYYEEIRRGGLESSPSTSLIAQRALTRRRDELEPYFALPSVEPVNYREVRVPTRWKRLRRYGIEHPVKSSVFAILMVTILSLGGNSLVRHLLESPNPCYFYYDTSSHKFKVYDSTGKVLWSLFSFDVEGLKLETEYKNATNSAVTDFMGLGQNQVLTILPDVNGYSEYVRVFDGKGKVLEKYSFPDSILTFNGLHYFAPFSANDFTLYKATDGEQNLLLSMNDGRSPAVLVRLDSKLVQRGVYWHYGTFYAYLLNGKHDGVREIALVGSNDVQDMSSQNYTFLAVLDPMKLVGNQESSLTKGFGYPVSDAELYYIKFPKTDLEQEAGHGPEVLMIDPPQTDSLFQVGIKSDPQPNTHNFYGFDYVFDARTLAVRSVKFSSPTEVTYAKLKREGKLHGTFDQDYLENLKNGVRYWDGTEWVKTPTRIRHVQTAAK